MTREEAIKICKQVRKYFKGGKLATDDTDAIYGALTEAIEALSTDIVRCKDCRKHNQGINEAPYLADRCPLIIHRGYAKGHEFDYQFCCFGERKE